MGRQNWAEALRLKSDADSKLKWVASYGYFNSTLFLGDFEKAMSLMAEQSSRYYAALDDAIEDSSTVVARYVKHGFRGVYHLVRGEDEKALESLVQAARLSAIGGNRFAEEARL